METEENGSAATQQRPVRKRTHWAGILEDHLNLAALECEYEVSQGTRLLTIWAAAFALILAAFLLIQVGIVYGLASLGLPIWGACLLLGALYTTVAIVGIFRFGRRDPKAGPAFSGTMRELRESLRWMRSLL